MAEVYHPRLPGHKKTAIRYGQRLERRLVERKLIRVSQFVTILDDAETQSHHFHQVLDIDDRVKIGIAPNFQSLLEADLAGILESDQRQSPARFAEFCHLALVDPRSSLFR